MTHMIVPPSLPISAEISSWEELMPFTTQLMASFPDHHQPIEPWLEKLDRFLSALEEIAAVRYIHMTTDTSNDEYRLAYENFEEKISPELRRFTHQINRKVVAHPAFSVLPDKPYRNLKRIINTDIKLFREENISLKTKCTKIVSEFFACVSSLTVEWEGNQITLKEATTKLEENDRKVRESAWRKIYDKRLAVAEEVDNWFTGLIQLRTQIAKNAGYNSYTDYAYAGLGRFDFGRKEVEALHTAIENEVTPIYQSFIRERKAQLGISEVYPWDVFVDPEGNSPLKPFTTTEELTNKAIQGLESISAALAKPARYLKEKGLLDLGTRKNKAPGGYNYPLSYSGDSFIFMNAAGTQEDVSTLFHELGHAIHNYQSLAVPLSMLRNVPSEVAELASMSMELISMDAWRYYYPEKKELNRAKQAHLKAGIGYLPWIATIDAFQHWLYDNPNHSSEERNSMWKEIYYRFHGRETLNWSPVEQDLLILWQKQIHLFETPFYYIEYAFAQLGAYAVWKNYRQTPEKALSNYLSALKQGYTETVPRLYEIAGAKFDFSTDYIHELIAYVQKELQKSN